MEYRLLGRIPRDLGARAAFTLVEVLATLTVIATLAGLILAGVLSVRRQAQVAHCATNLMQLGVAIKLYVADCGTVPLVYYQGSGTNRDPKRPPSPAPDHDIQFVLRDYQSLPDLYRCPVTSGLPPPCNAVKYPFNSYASGLRPSQMLAGGSKALMMCDPIGDPWWSAQGHRLNALFLDGHVKAYPWVEMMSPLARNITWPPD